MAMHQRKRSGDLEASKLVAEKGLASSVKIESCEGNRRDDWEAVASAAEDATVGHLWAWRDIIGSAYGFDSLYLLVRDHNGNPIAAAPFIFIHSRFYGNELVSMPYIDYGGVCHADFVIHKERAALDRAIFDYATEVARDLKCRRLHVRTKQPIDARFEISTEKVTQHLALVGSCDEQMKRLPSERRNRLKRCARLGLVTEVAHSIDERALARFMAIYSENMRELGSPTHGLAFFRQVVASLKDSLSLIMIRHDGVAIAAALALEHRKIMSLPWSGATPAARPIYGSNALYWAAICLAIERGCHTFDFGRSSVGSGIFEFKRQWGPTPQQAYWNTLCFKPGARSPRQRKDLKIASALWKRMPLGLTRMLGPSLRKGISN